MSSINENSNFFFCFVTDDLVNRYTDFTTATPRSLESMKSYLSTTKNQYTSNVINKKEDTRYAEPDPSLRPFFQFLLNSTKRKKRSATKSPDSRLVEDFINYSINDLRNPVHADSLNSIILMNTPGIHSSYNYKSETQYLPVPIYTKVPKPKPTEYDLATSISMSNYLYYQTTTPDPYKNWQETPLIFPNSNIKPSTTHSPFISSNYYLPEKYNIPALVNDQAPTFITPVEYQGPMFVTPISVTQSPLSDGKPPPTIVILEDIETVADPPLSDPIVQQDSGGASAGAGSGAAAAAIAAAAAAAGAGIGAGVGITGIAGGVAAAAAAGGAGGGAGGIGGAGVDGILTPADEVQCRADGSATKVCSDLITTSTSPSSSSYTSFLESLISLISSFNFIGPLMLAFWSIVFPPMSIILTSGLGFISFMFPWLMPRLWFGRQNRQTFNMNQFNQRLDNTPNYSHQPYYY